MVGNSWWCLFFTGEKESSGYAFDQAALEWQVGQKIIARICQTKQGSEFTITNRSTLQRT